MDFTREPIIESVVTPRDGYKLVIRSSKGTAQEEYFVDSLEMVSFGGSFFYRSLERPKSFLVPVSDYEVIEAREARMVLKSASPDRGAIRIGGGKKDKEEDSKPEQPKQEKSRRRSNRRRRKEEVEEPKEQQPVEVEAEVEVTESVEEVVEKPVKPKKKESQKPVVSSLLPPPKTLIRDSMERYRDDEQFAKAFFSADEALPEEASHVESQSEEPITHREEPVSEEPLEQEGDLPFGEGDGSEEVSGEEEKSEIDAFLPDDSH